MHHANKVCPILTWLLSRKLGATLTSERLQQFIMVYANDGLFGNLRKIWIWPKVCYWKKALNLVHRKSTWEEAH